MVPSAALGLLLCVQLCQGSGELRLVGGGGRCAGRVEVKHEGEWGSVCNYDFDWEARWATVVCQQLGCGRALRSSPNAPFGQGSGRIWLQPFFCRGVESRLQDCPHFGWGRHFCGHQLDVGVTCAEAVELRLAGGGGPCAGRVEVKLRGRWGSVADPNWGPAEAEVVCQQLGCGSAAGVVAAATSRFGRGDGPVGLALVDCRGHEATIWDCEIRGWGPYGGVHDYDTAVVCQGFSRLADGDGGCSGRLEVRRGQTWTRVCRGHVDARAAQVVCRELGCGAAVAVAGQVAVGTGPFWDGAFDCAGTEPLLSACARRPPRSQGCAGPAGIVCSPYTGFRLANGSGCAGRVEVEVGDTWGSLCATSWDLPDAHVLCRHLGCGSAIAVPPGGSFGVGAGPLRPDAFGCVGTEQHPGRCPVALLGQPPCPPGLAAAALCSGAEGNLTLTQQDLSGTATAPAAGTRSGRPSLRLWGGSGRCSGHLEVLHEGSWGRVCANGTSPATATTVCRHLGCGHGGRLAAAPARSPAPAWLAWVGCEEGSRALWRCPSAPWHRQLCGPDGDTHVTCDHDSAGGMPSPTPGGPAPAGPSGTAVGLRVLCAVLGVLLCLALGALTLQVGRARRTGPRRAPDATSEAVYEELDYTLALDYQEVPSRPGSLSQGSGMELPSDSGDWDPWTAPAPPGHYSPPDGYDDAVDELDQSPTGATSKGVARQSWGCGPPPGWSCPQPRPQEPPGAPWLSSWGPRDCDHASSSPPGSSP